MQFLKQLGEHNLLWKQSQQLENKMEEQLN